MTDQAVPDDPTQTNEDEVKYFNKIILKNSIFFLL
jgi:hypothetical protein